MSSQYANPTTANASDTYAAPTLHSPENGLWFKGESDPVRYRGEALVRDFWTLSQIKTSAREFAYALVGVGFVALSLILNGNCF